MDELQREKGKSGGDGIETRRKSGYDEQFFALYEQGFFEKYIFRSLLTKNLEYSGLEFFTEPECEELFGRIQAIYFENRCCATKP